MTVEGRPITAAAEDVDRLAAGEHHDPHSLLGAHREGARTVVRVFRPDATGATVIWSAHEVAMDRADARGLYEAVIDTAEIGDYRLRLSNAGAGWDAEDPYRFVPTIGDLDLHLIGEGTHTELWRRLGSRVIVHQGVRGTAFAVWAPNARGVAVASDANHWNPRIHPMRSMGGSGVWELFIPGVAEGTRYKYLVTQENGRRVMKADPLARAAEHPPANASVVTESVHRWRDGVWMRARSEARHVARPMSVYEVHLGSWRRGEGRRVLTYRELGEQLADYCVDMGFTHVELMPIAEHPFGGSWGYQVSGYYAPTARHGAPDDFRWMVDHLHQRGVGVILDWVPAHFPRDDWGLARFDGTALYEHMDPRLGAHPDWGTLVFNYGRNEVRNFLVANARYWADEFHIDGLRMDAVASMLYLDYSRKPGEWVPNVHGGNENLAAIDLLREVNAMLGRDFPGVMAIAEESTAWPGVTRTTVAGGLGFYYKWNMGWMHDTLDYLSNDPVFRRYHHHQLTFGLLYAWSENYILPLSHDEVSHGKGSLFAKMPGDRWRKFANLRALLAWMWAHPGKQMLFMGGEFGQEREWRHDHSVDWHLLAESDHAGVQRLVRDLNARYAATPALWEADNRPQGFRWIDAGDADQNFYAFLRYDEGGDGVLACIANFSPVVHRGFRIGLPRGGAWTEVLNTDAHAYGGSDVGNLGRVVAEDITCHGLAHSAELTLPPLAVVWLVPERSPTAAA